MKLAHVYRLPAQATILHVRGVWDVTSREIWHVVFSQFKLAVLESVIYIHRILYPAYFDNLVVQTRSNKRGHSFCQVPHWKGGGFFLALLGSSGNRGDDDCGGFFGVFILYTVYKTI